MEKTHVRILIFTVSLLSGAVFAMSSAGGSAPTAQFELGAAAAEADRLMPEINAGDIVFVGERHDELAYHHNQLAVIAALRERGLQVAIGLEMIQTPFQDALDDYIAGGAPFSSLLRHTEYFSRWRFDPRLYADIFEYARQHRIPLVALNAPREITDRVSEVGIDGLDVDQRATFSASLSPLPEAYRAELAEVFEVHQHLGDQTVERFIEVQRVWDETMAWRSMQYLKSQPGHVLVVLAGIGHVAYGHGIPTVIEHHAATRSVIVLSDIEREQMPQSADVYLAMNEAELPQQGKLGVMISVDDGGAVINGFSSGSPAEDAGARAGDAIVGVNGQPISSFEDVRLALFGSVPGDPVSIDVDHPEQGRRTLSLTLY